MADAPVMPNVSCLHTTVASRSDQKLSHTVPHTHRGTAPPYPGTHWLHLPDEHLHSHMSVQGLEMGRWRGGRVGTTQTWQQYNNWGGWG